MFKLSYVTWYKTLKIYIFFVSKIVGSWNFEEWSCQILRIFLLRYKKYCQMFSTTSANCLTLPFTLHFSLPPFWCSCMHMRIRLKFLKICRDEAQNWLIKELCRYIVFCFLNIPWGYVVEILTQIAHQQASYGGDCLRWSIKYAFFIHIA